MSEYQYYEFRAVDRPLSAAEQKELRAVSTRASISARGFVNHYEWGDFKGNPDRFMERYFDLFLYLANWGSRRFSMRLPKRLLDAADLERFFVGAEDADYRRRGDDLIVDVERHDIEYEDWDDGRGWLDSLAGLRTDLLEGDLRGLYLVWLMAVETVEVPDDAVEPLPGIAPLTPSLEAFAEFFCIDGDLVAAAAEGSAAPPAANPSRAAVEEAINGLGEAERIAFLVRLHDGDPCVRAELRRRCRARNASSVEHRERRRTAGELRAAARQLAEARERAEAARRLAEARRREQEAAKARRRRLDDLSKRGEAAWTEVEGLIGLRNGSAYEKATALLGDLRDLAIRESTDDTFHHRLAALRDRHRTKPRLIEQLAAAELD